jgi:hypothetical protein
LKRKKYTFSTGVEGSGEGGLAMEVREKPVCGRQRQYGMNTSMANIIAPEAVSVLITEDSLTVDLMDGRTITVPLTWFPRIIHGNSAERKNWKLVGNGKGIHWEELDEDISVEGLLAGKPSEESQQSFKNRIRYHSKAAA